MGLYYAQIQPRRSNAAGVETVQLTTSIPTNGAIEALIIKVDGLQAGGTDSADDAIIGKIDTITLTSGTVKTELTGVDSARIAQRVFGDPILYGVGEADNEGLAASWRIHFNGDVINGNINFMAPYGIPKGGISQISILTASDVAATDTTFLTVWAIMNTAKAGGLWLQYKRITRTAVAGALIDDNITDLATYCGYFGFLTTGVKDAAGAVPAGLGVRGIQLFDGGQAVGDQVTSDAITTGGVQYIMNSATATTVTIANYDCIWQDYGLRNGGKQIANNNSFVRVEEGVAEARRGYHIGYGVS